MSRLGRLESWEALVVDAVGNVIEFWGFKRNQGRVWALLYLRGRPMAAAEIQADLGLSKGAVSMVTRELELWGVVGRVRAPADAVWQFAAETDVMAMVRRVLSDREMPLVAKARAELERAEAEARSRKAPAVVLARLARLRLLATTVDRAIAVFLQTARLDVAGVANVLTERLLRRRASRREA